MAKGISEIVAEAFGAGDAKVTVYRALRQLICAACGGTIPEGSLYQEELTDALRQICG